MHFTTCTVRGRCRIFKDTTSYIEAATGFLPINNSLSFSQKKMKIGDDAQVTKVIETSIRFELRVRVDFLS